MAPVVVILSAPVSMAPKPLLMEPEPKAPVPVIAVLTASLVSTRAASLPSSRLNSVASTVTALRTKVELLLPVTVRVPVLLPRPSVLPAVVAMVVLPAMLAPPALTVRPPVVTVKVELEVSVPVTLVLSWSSMVPAELSTMLPLVVVVRFRLPLVALRAALILVLARLDRAVLAQPEHVPEPPATPPITRHSEAAVS